MKETITMNFDMDPVPRRNKRSHTDGEQQGITSIRGKRSALLPTLSMSEPCLRLEAGQIGLHHLGFKCVRDDDVSFIRVCPHGLRYSTLLEEIEKIYGSRMKITYEGFGGHIIDIVDGDTLLFAYNDWKLQSRQSPKCWRFSLES